MNGRTAAFFVFVISALNTLFFFSKIFLGCHSIVNGIGRQGIETNFNYSISCNSECGCRSAKLFPVCDITGRSYYSPCHAGCRHVNIINVDSYNLVRKFFYIKKKLLIKIKILKFFFRNFQIVIVCLVAVLFKKNFVKMIVKQCHIYFF